MNSKGHLTVSLIKSVVRMVGCAGAMVLSTSFPVLLLAGALLVAEILGIVEELVDNRK